MQIGLNLQFRGDRASPRRRGGGLPLVGAAVWVNPYDLSSMRQERTGAAATTPAVVDGPVGTIRNKGTAGGYFIADHDNRRPTLRSDGLFYWLEFDGNVATDQGDYLRLPAPGLSLVTLEMYLGAEIIDWVTGQSGLVTFSAGTVGQSASDFQRVDAIPFYINSANYAVAVRAGPASSLIISAAGIIRRPHVFELLKPNNSTASVVIDGGTAATDSAITDVFTSMGGDLILGARQGNGINSPGNFRLFQLAVTNAVTDDRTDIRAYFQTKTTGTPPFYPDIADLTELQAARDLLISEVFSTVGGVLPTDVASVATESPHPLDGVVTISNLANCEKLTVPGYEARPRLWTPNAARTDLFVFLVAGHDVGWSGNGLAAVCLNPLLALGIPVVTFVLPGGPDDKTSGDPAEHEADMDPLSAWVGPVSIAINTILADHPNARIYMAGISGGGWMTQICGACDKRIDGTYQFVGSVPEHLHLNRDWEQRLPGVTAGYLTLYLLGASPGRRHKHILYENDPVGFNRATVNTGADWTATLTAQAASLGGGYYEVVWVDYNQHAFANPSFADEFIADLPAQFEVLTADDGVTVLTADDGITALRAI